MEESWDRRQAAEDRWRQALEKHNDDPRAHSAERHDQNNDWVARWVLPTRQEIQTEHELVDQLEARMTRLEQLGWEIRGGLIVIGAAVTGGLVTLIAHTVGWI